MSEQTSQNKYYSNTKQNSANLIDTISQEVPGIISSNFLDASTLDIFFSFRPVIRYTENDSYKTKLEK